MSRFGKRGVSRRSLLLVLGLLAAGCWGVRRPEAPNGPHFSVLTYNVHYSGSGRQLTLDAIRKSAADIVCLQETTPAWEQFLRPALQPVYPHMRYKHFGGGGGLAILSKWPVDELEYVPSSASWFPGWLLKVVTPVGPVQFLAVHLRPALHEDGSFGLGPFLASKAVRREEIESLYGHLKPGLPTIMLGDSNEGNAGRAVRWLQGKGLTDALREFDRGTTTWRMRYGPLRLAFRLDHIFYSKELHCLEARVLREGGSDHFPVLATFQASHGK
jgi:endonuclease/exonuclease/phosphatase (EEP) superfamily protein YafD